MVSLELNQDHCIRCGRCISVCPQRILGRHTNGSVDVLHGALARCIRCGHCVAVCPKAALTLEHIAPSSLPLVEDAPLSDLQRDMLFKTRRSTRAYKDEPVDRNVLLKALEEARYAPTASNCEEVAWLLVEGRDAEIIQKLLEETYGDRIQPLSYDKSYYHWVDASPELAGSWNGFYNSPSDGYVE